MNAVQCVIVALCIFALSCSDPSGDFAVQQFTLSGDFGGEGPDFSGNHRKLTYDDRPVQTMNCKITPPDDKPYSYVSVHYLPGIPETVGTNWAEPYVPADAPNGLRAKSKEASGEKLLRWGISPGDPNGEYRIEIFVNGNLLDTLFFDVEGVPPAA